MRVPLRVRSDYHGQPPPCAIAFVDQVFVAARILAGVRACLFPAPKPCASTPSAAASRNRVPVCSGFSFPRAIGHRGSASGRARSWRIILALSSKVPSCSASRWAWASKTIFENQADLAI